MKTWVAHRRDRAPQDSEHFVAIDDKLQPTMGSVSSSFWGIGREHTPWYRILRWPAFCLICGCYARENRIVSLYDDEVATCYSCCIWTMLLLQCYRLISSMRRYCYSLLVALTQSRERGGGFDQVGWWVEIRLNAQDRFQSPDRPI